MIKFIINHSNRLLQVRYQFHMQIYRYNKKKSDITKLCRTFADSEGDLQNSERLSIATLRRRFRYYKRPAIGATNDGVRIGAKTINDPEVDRDNLNSLLYSVSAGMAKERTVHACPRGLASLRRELREHLFLQTDPIHSFITSRCGRAIERDFENASKFRPSDDPDAAVSLHVNSFRIPMPTSGTMPPYILRD